MLQCTLVEEIPCDQVNRIGKKYQVNSVVGVYIAFYRLDILLQWVSVPQYSTENRSRFSSAIASVMTYLCRHSSNKTLVVRLRLQFDT